MHIRGGRPGREAALWVLGLLLLSPFTAKPQELGAPGRAEVRALHGTATVTTNNGPARPLKTGAVLGAGAVIRTGPASTLDLFLGRSAGMIRVAENSALVLDKLRLVETGADTAVEIQLHLPEGEMFFNVNKLSKASRYEIKMPSGVAGIRGTQGSLCARADGAGKPPVVLLQGSLVFVHVPAGGAMASHVMSAPPAVLFSPTEGVKVAPLPLAQGVAAQLEESAKEIEKEPAKKPGRAPGHDNNGDNGGRNSNNERTEPFLSPASGSRAPRR